MYKMLVLDMDGTLLNDEHKISEENIRAIREAREIGVKVVLASGRVLGGLLPYLEELNLIDENNYSVACTGALVVNNTNTEILGSNNLTIKDLKYIYDIANKLNLTLSIYTPDSILVSSDSMFSKYDSIVNNIPFKLVDFDSLDEKVQLNKINLINEDIDGLQKIKEFFNGIETENVSLKDIDIKIANKRKKGNIKKGILNPPKDLFDRYTVVQSTSFMIEIVNKNCNKWFGVRKIAERLNIKEEEIICVGDSENDKHMIKNAGLGVAMGNAFPKIKDIADFVTYTNVENGVAHVIDRFILGKERAYAG
ncbi:Cof-type HAD-IIB family hydrolase [Thermohalobacter berrensis]|uniref:Haloacid dehalogenase n=1 Tax=Thermohalobacter berrensis TaxID=99594 RepID=A0A419T9N9_9FIRM|nr:Cof-type HAD-IIB family hydrolase [Thermohalobacter berrensis]RKD34192.1 hypothetical protein BET03_07840 [Thermohalobacter berrensis]